MHVLLIEPDSILAKTYCAAFERVGWSVTHVRGAQQAVSAADDTRPDIVVLELQLAGHSGSAFLYEFRTYADWLAIPVVLHTLTPPDTLRVYERAFAELGVVAKLYKPHTPLRQLLATITACTPARV